MSKERQQLRVMFECANTHIANSVMFALSTRVPMQCTDTDIFAILAGGVHSHGRFVFTYVESDLKDAYDRAYKFAHSQLHGVALIGATPESIPWDSCGMQVLQASETEVSSVQVYENARKRLAQDYVEYVDITKYDSAELLDIIQMCRLHDDPLGQGDSALQEEFLYQASLPSKGQRVERCLLGADIYRAYVGFCDDETEGTKLVWRVMAHLLLRQRYMG